MNTLRSKRFLTAIQVTAERFIGRQVNSFAAVFFYLTLLGLSVTFCEHT